MTASDAAARIGPPMRSVQTVALGRSSNQAIKAAITATIMKREQTALMDSLMAEGYIATQFGSQRTERHAVAVGIAVSKSVESTMNGAPELLIAWRDCG